MISLLFCGGLFAIVLPSYCQSPSISIRATAQVIDKAGIEVITIRDMEIDIKSAVDGIIHIPALYDPRVGVMMIKGKPLAYARITYLVEMKLVNIYGSGTLLFKYEVNGFDANNQQAGEPLDAVERLIRFNGEGEYFLWVGGRIDINNAQPGSYDGEFTLEIEYI